MTTWVLELFDKGNWKTVKRGTKADCQRVERSINETNNRLYQETGVNNILVCRVRGIK